MVRVCLLMGDNIFSLNVHVQLLVCTVLSVILSQGVSVGQCHKKRGQMISVMFL